MRPKRSVALPIAALLSITAAHAAVIETPAAAQNIDYYAGVLWDDGDADRGIMDRGTMPIPDAIHLQRAGMVAVREVARNQGRLMIAGHDQLGRLMHVTMDIHAGQVLAVKVAGDLFAQRRNQG